jgi:hypothetical protein
MFNMLIINKLQHFIKAPQNRNRLNINTLTRFC